MEKTAILVLCAVTGEFHAQRPVTRSFDVFFDLYPNKRLSKQSRCRVLDTIVLITTSLWCLQDYAHYAGNVAFCLCLIIMRQQPMGIDPSECGKLVAPCQRDVNPVKPFALCDRTEPHEFSENCNEIAKTKSSMRANFPNALYKQSDYSHILL